MKILRKLLGCLLVLLSLLFLVYLAGPRPAAFAPDGQLPAVTDQPEALEARIQATEAAVIGLKPDNEARIIWADPEKKDKTPYSMVYIHGFGASQAEGRPVHTALASQFGCNLYLPRLNGHGIDRADALSTLTAANYLDSALEAVAIGQALGDNVILVATSTGASMALYIASQNPEIAAVLAYAPLIDTVGGLLFIPRGPWGRQLVGAMRGDPVIVERPDSYKGYWSRMYAPEAYVALSVLIDGIMTEEVYQQVTCPVFVGIYYKSEAEQDKVVSVQAIREMFPQLGTPDSQKVLQEFPDTGNHVIASDLRSADWQTVLSESAAFLMEQLEMTP